MKTTHELRLVITPECNYNCYFCHKEGCDCSKQILAPEDYQYTAKILRNLLGWHTLTITGGEPLLHPNYRQICKLLKELGLRVTTVTNLSLLSNPEILVYNDQINVSLHSMDAEVYKKITGSKIPLSQIIDKIKTIRTNLPVLDVHLNATIIRNKNDDIKSMEGLVRFAASIDAKAKFIDLASENAKEVVPYEEIKAKVSNMGFEKTSEEEWQSSYKRDTDHVIITKCGFSKQNIEHSNGYRNLFLYSDGKLKYDQKTTSLNLLKEIKGQDTNTIVNHIKDFLPPAKNI